MGGVALDEQPLLLDTVALMFWHADSPRLPSRVRAALMRSLSRPIYVSAVSAFEIATKVRTGKLRVPPAIGRTDHDVRSTTVRLEPLRQR